MQYQGVLKKMATENGAQVQYYLEMDTDFLHMNQLLNTCLLYTSPSPRDVEESRMPSSA